MTTDLAKKPLIDMRTLERFLDDIRYQPMWRAEADRAADYYDGRQLEPSVIAEMKQRGQPILIHNLIAPTINGVLGLEARTRTDWQVTADDDSGLEVAEGLNFKLNQAARICRADRAVADAYAGQVKAGLGWVEVGRNNDPFRYPYRVNYVHRNEIFWDWHSQEPDLSDARWLVRQKWLDTDELKLGFPQHAELIDAVACGWSGWDRWDTGEALSQSPSLMGAYTDFIQSNIAGHDWWDSARRRALTYETWYRTWENKPVLRTETGEAAVYDHSNRLHHAILAAGKAEIVIAPFARMRLAYFVGPHRLADLDSPHPHNKFPYVPFWGYREDRTRIPYGMIRGMMPAQDEINHRRSKLTQLLNMKLVIKDDDALLNMSDNDMVDELYRADGGVINLNPNRQNKDANAFRLVTDLNIASQQYQVMQEAQKMIQDVAGVYSAFLGQDSGAKSGVAIDSLVEQGTTTLAELNDNYRFARQSVGELLLAHIVDDIGSSRHEIKIDVNEPRKSRVIVLNDRRVDGGVTQVTNSVIKTKTQVALTDIANTPTYRAQLARSLMDMAGQLPEQYQAALIDLIVELTDVPNRDEIIKRIKQVNGQVDPEDMSEEELAQMQRKQQLDQAIEDIQLKEMDLRLEKLMAEVRQLNARAGESEIKAQVTAGGADADKEKVMAEITKIRAEVKEIISKTVQVRSQLRNAVNGEIALEQRRVPRALPAQPI